MIFIHIGCPNMSKPTQKIWPIIYFILKLSCFSVITFILFICTLLIIGAIFFDIYNHGNIYKSLSFYDSHNGAIVGVFTSLGALFTVGVFYTTHKATKNAEKNLDLVRENLRKDDFVKQFTLLLDLHNKSHAIMMENIDRYSEKNNEKIIIGEKDKKNTLIDWTLSDVDAAEKLYRKYEFSPYMRTLFRILKHIDNNFFNKEFENEENEFKAKKEYSSVLRCMIRNDVLYFVAINSLNKRPIFRNYEEKLTNLCFFEHLNPYEINDELSFKLDEYIKKLNIINLIDAITLNEIYKINKIKVLNKYLKTNYSLTLHYPFPIVIIYKFMKWEHGRIIEKITNEINEIICIDNINKTLNTVFFDPELKKIKEYHIHKALRINHNGTAESVSYKGIISISDEVNLIKNNNENKDDFIKRKESELGENIILCYRHEHRDSNVRPNNILTLENLYSTCMDIIQTEFRNKLDINDLINKISTNTKVILIDKRFKELENKEITIRSSIN